MTTTTNSTTTKLDRAIQKLSSRKFMLSLATYLAGLIALFYPEYADTATDVLMRIAGAVAMIASAVTYVFVEGSIDKTRKE